MSATATVTATRVGKTSEFTVASQTAKTTITSAVRPFGSNMRRVAKDVAAKVDGNDDTLRVGFRQTDAANGLLNAVAEHMITDMAEFIRLASHVYTKAGSRGAQAKPIKTLMAKHVDGYIGLKHDPASAQLISTSVKAHVAEHGVRV